MGWNPFKKDKQADLEELGKEFSVYPKVAGVPDHPAPVADSSTWLGASTAPPVNPISSTPIAVPPAHANPVLPLAAVAEATTPDTPIVAQAAPSFSAAQAAPAQQPSLVAPLPLARQAAQPTSPPVPLPLS